MRIEIWSDIVCPYCYVGKHELENAIARFNSDAEFSNTEFEIVYRSFELNPTTEASSSLNDVMLAKYQMSRDQLEAQQQAIASRAADLGLEYNWQNALDANTFDAHRLIKLAGTSGKVIDAEEKLMRAFFTEGKDVSDHQVLTEVGAELGLDTDRVAEVLAGDEFTDQVRIDEIQAQQYGISGVPFFVFEGKWALSGAQPADVFDAALKQVAAELAKRPGMRILTLNDTSSTGGSCGCGGCGCK